LRLSRTGISVRNKTEDREKTILTYMVRMEIQTAIKYILKEGKREIASILKLEVHL
jgi:hypothetical protein